MRTRRIVGAALVVAGLVITGPVTGTSSAAPPAAPQSTPELIDAAVAEGRLSREDAATYLVYAIREPERLPSEYRSSVPWHATAALVEYQSEVAATTPIEALDQLPPDGAVRACSTLFSLPKLNIYETAHFYIEYNALELSGATIEQYAASLEEAWTTEVGTFGWPAPPVKTSDPAPGNRYHVRIENLGPFVYGFVTNGGRHAGNVGDNPNSSWTETDAQASCMVLNADMPSLPGSTTQQALDATTAHEFNHSLVFGVGALSGTNRPELNFVEGMATVMEDEVQDGANDAYFYLWPAFDDAMGEHDRGDPYSYWVIFRAMFERYGTTTPGGLEQMLQDFWRTVSQADSGSGALMQDALAAVLKSKGTTLADAYHAAAIALRFNRPCGGGYSYPYCLEEGPGYVARAGRPPTAGELPGPGVKGIGQLEDDYTLHWVTLPLGESYSVTLHNASDGGTIRASIACDTGSGLKVSPLPEPVGGGETTKLRAFDPAGCAETFAVVTNVTHTSADPDVTPAREYHLSLGAPEAAPPTTTTPPPTAPPGSVSNPNTSAARLSPSAAKPGEVVVVSADGFAPDQAGLAMTLHSDPLALGIATTDGAGAFTTTFEVPLAASPGTHEVRVTGLDVSGAQHASVGTLEVLDLDCSDFASQAAAQQVLVANAADPHNLDGDDDGIACEELGGATGGPSSSSGVLGSPTRATAGATTELARTGRSTGALSVFGFASVLVGAALVISSSRPPRRILSFAASAAAGRLDASLGRALSPEEARANRIRFFRQSL